MSQISKILTVYLVASPFFVYASHEISAHGKYIATSSSQEIVIQKKNTQKAFPAKVPKRKSCLLAFVPVYDLTSIIWGYMVDLDQNASLSNAVRQFSHIDTRSLMLEAIEDGATNLDEALFWAVARRALNRIELLLAYGANSNATTDTDPWLGKKSSALIAAFIYLHKAPSDMQQIVELLLKAGALPEKQNANGQSLLTLIASSNLESKDREALNALCAKYAK